MPRKNWNHAKIFTSPSHIDKRRRRQLGKLLRSPIPPPDSFRRNSIGSPPRLADLLYRRPPSPKEKKDSSPQRQTGDGSVPPLLNLSNNEQPETENEGEDSAKALREFLADAVQGSMPLAPEEEPEAQVYLMSDIGDLMTDLEPGAIVGLDIDETLIMTRHSPSLLLTEEGVRAFQMHVHERFTDFQTKNKHCRLLQKALQDKVLVQEKTAHVVRSLQTRGCHVFGLTARFAEMAPSTKKTLTELGLDLSKTAPLPQGKSVTDPVTGAVAVDGVIYCNSVEKGLVLDRYLTGVMLPEVKRRQDVDKIRDKENMDVSNSPTLPSTPSKPALTSCQVFVVDDRYDMCESVWRSLSNGAAKRLSGKGVSLSVAAYHYCSSNLQSDPRLSHSHTKRKVLSKQMDVFIEEGRVLSDRDALMAVCA